MRRRYPLAGVIAGAVASAFFMGASCEEEERDCTREEHLACQDGIFCNGSERCSFYSGGPHCQVGGSLPCLPSELCDEAAKRCYTPECQDAAECDDGDLCTADRCERQQCLHETDCTLAGRDGCACDDGDVCTNADVCAGGSCHGEPRSCPLGQVCEPEGGGCVDAEGACCLPSGLCEELSVDDCDFRVGSYRGGGASCADTTCATGACCLPSGACADLTEAACGEDEGVYRGDAAACTAVDCTRGACCTGGACAIASDSECEAGGGAFEGNGVACAADTCGEPVACCVRTPGRGDGEATASCELAADTAACGALGGAVVSGATACPEVDPAGDFDACLADLTGAWSMRVYDPVTGAFSGDAQPWFFTGALVDPGDLLGGYVLVDGRPTSLPTADGPVSLFYALYTGYAVGGDTITAEGCPQPSGFPGGQYWTARTVSGGTLTRDPCTGECVLSFTETLVTTEPDGDVFTSEYRRRSVGRGPVPDGLCYRPCLDACHPDDLPERCWRQYPDPPFMSEFGDQDTWAANVLESRACLE